MNGFKQVENCLVRRGQAYTCINYYKWEKFGVISVGPADTEN